MLELCRSNDANTELCFGEAQVAPLQDVEVPKRIMLLPPLSEIKAVDGRVFRISDPEKVVLKTIDSGLDLPVDVNHSTEILGPAGHEAPAVGWIKNVYAENGSVYGDVEWTGHGYALIATKQYKYISPAFLQNKKTKEVEKIASAALVTTPAIATLPALASAMAGLTNGSSTPEELEKVNMKELLAKLAATLKISDDADGSAVMQAVESLVGKVDEAAQKSAEELKKIVEERDGAVQTASKLKTELANAQSLSVSVPRADYDLVCAKAESAQQEITEMKAATQKASAQKAIDEALAARKITPATSEYHLERCMEAGGLEAFSKFVAAAPVVVEQESQSMNRQPDESSQKLTELEQEIALCAGLTPEQYLKGKGASK